MSQNNITDEELIELAKKAKPVPVSHRLNKVGDEGISSIHNFLRELKIESGKNKFDMELMYDNYVEYIAEPLTDKVFLKHMKKIIKTTSDGLHYKTNITPMTLLKRMKELLNDEEKDPEEISTPREE